MNINNNATNVKKELLVRIAKLQLAGMLDSREINKIPTQMKPMGANPIGCCIFHDRELLKMRILARMGISVENYNEQTELDEYAKEYCSKGYGTIQNFQRDVISGLLKEWKKRYE